jgi:hypothetical protein
MTYRNFSWLPLAALSFNRSHSTIRSWKAAAKQFFDGKILLCRDFRRATIEVLGNLDRQIHPLPPMRVHSSLGLITLIPNRSAPSKSFVYVTIVASCSKASAGEITGRHLRSIESLEESIRYTQARFGTPKHACWCRARHRACRPIYRSPATTTSYE